MKRGIVLILIVNFILVSGVVWGLNCVDSDGGINPYVKGNISGTLLAGTSIDRCSDSNPNLVQEYTCSGIDNDHWFWPIEYYCPNGCLDGACQGDPTTTCQEGWKCVSYGHDYEIHGIGYLLSSCNWQNTDVNNLISKVIGLPGGVFGGSTLWSPTSWKRIEYCIKGCENDRCIQEDLNQAFRYIDKDVKTRYIGDESFKFNFRIQNNLDRPLENVSISIDDKKGWKKEQFLGFEEYQTRNISFDFFPKQKHSLYNPHIFTIKVNDNEIKNISLSIFDKNAFVSLSTEEPIEENIIKTVYLGNKQYKIELIYADSSSAYIRINDDWTKTISDDSNAFRIMPDGTYVVAFSADENNFHSSATIALGQEGIQATCLDSDDGKDYGLKGEICFGVDCREDSCSNAELIEYYCQGNDILSETHSCESGKECQNGRCRDIGSTCIDECSLSENKDCFNSTSYRICGNYDYDSCLKWSEAILCPMGPIGRGCINDGVCVTEAPDPNPEPTQECEPIGLRTDGKYCSPEYEWELQKLEKNSCENDFECKGNDCSDGTCGEVSVVVEEDKGWVIWLIIGGIVLIIFLVIFLVIKR